MSKLVICKTCGNDDLTEVSDGLLKCKYCRHLTEKPKENADLMEMAHNLRFNTKDFDEAAKKYEEVIRLTPDEAEAYWGKVLCRFGIEYVKDKNGEYLPTCHRTIASSILEDSDYLMALSKANGELKEYYSEQAKLIDTYQTKIKVIAAKEEPYDVFISFKATDENNNPTADSSIAQEIYYYLTKNLGLKVFFSNITLKNKMGQEFEPIIYAALNSATVMVLVGTNVDYINATWVKNEWSRYIAMMDDAKREGKNKYLIPAIKGIKPEQLPSALASYQAVDMGEVAAKDRLCSNIDFLIGEARVGSKKQTSVQLEASDMLMAEATNLCNLGFQSIAIGEMDKAGEYFQKALEKKSDTSLAFWGKLLISEGASTDEQLAEKSIPLKEYSLYKMAMECAKKEEKQRYEAVAKKCMAKVERADEKTRHNTEYHTKIENIKHRYFEKYKGFQGVTINETADKLFDEYHTAKARKEDAHEKRMKILRKVDLTLHYWLIAAAVVAIVLLVPAFGAEQVVTKMNDHLIECADFNMIESFDKAELSIGELFDSTENVDKRLGITPQQDKKLDTAFENFKLEDFGAGIWMLIIPMALLGWVGLFFIGYKLKGVLAGIVAALFLGGPIGVILMLVMFFIALLASKNWIIIVGAGIIAILLLIFVIRLLNNMRLSSIRRELGKIDRETYSQAHEALKALVAYSVKQIEDLNNEYKAKYGNDIEEYELSDCVAKHAFKIDDEELENYLNGAVASKNMDEMLDGVFDEFEAFNNSEENE